VRILEGLLGDSDREGYKRLYFTRELDHYAEFRAEDVVFREPIPPDQPPFFGQQATRVGIRRDAPIEFTRVRTPKPVDEFDLDVRLAGLRAGARPLFFGGDTSFGEACDTLVGDTCFIGHACVRETGLTPTACINRTCDRRTCPLTQCEGCSRLSCVPGVC
jgi:hypothetical protein